MLNPFSHSRQGPIGLDIGSEGVRMLQLSRADRALTVVAAARWRFPNQGAGLDPATRQKLAAEAVSEMLRSGGFRGRQVVAAIPAEDIAIKNVRLPRMSESELAGAVQWECKERFGFEVTPDRVHFINAGEVRQGTETRDEVMILAVREEAVAAQLDLLGRMKVVPRHIDAEPMALFRAYARFLRRAADEGTVSVVVDIGLHTTKIVIARGRTPLLIKHVGIAGANFNENVARGLKLSGAEAAHVRKRHVEAPAQGAGSEGRENVEWSVFDAVREPAEALAREVALCLRYCSVTFRGLRAAKITLTGGEAYDPALLRLLSQSLDCPCVVGLPLTGVNLRQAALGSDRRSELTEWSVATGLALRDLMDVSDDRNLSDEGTRLSA